MCSFAASLPEHRSGTPRPPPFETGASQGEEQERVVAEGERRTPLCGHLYDLLPSGQAQQHSGAASGAGALQELCSGRPAQAALVTALWWIAAVYVTMMFKLATLALQPFTLTWLVNTSTGILALLLSLATDFDSPPLPEMQWEEGLRLAALGLAQGCEFGCLNKSLQYLTVSERTMLQNINILLVLATAWLCGLERLTCLRVVAGLLLAGGGLLQGLDVSQAPGGRKAAQLAHVKGIAFMVTSMLLTAGKWSLVQLITQRSESTSALGRMSKLQLAARVQPVTGLVCLGLAGLFEARTLTLRHLLLSGVLLKVPLIAAGITVIQCSELKLVQLTSAVAVGVLMNLHHIPMVLAGVVLFHDRVDSLGVLGFGCCILGGLFYAGARYTDAQAAAGDAEQELVPPSQPEKARSSRRLSKEDLPLAGQAVAV